MKPMDLKDFVRLGILLEVNRQFFHPLGLAVNVEMDDADTLDNVKLKSILQDDDPEGTYFGEVDRDKVAAFRRWASSRAPERREILGYRIQPVDGEDDWETEAIERLRTLPPHERLKVLKPSSVQFLRANGFLSTAGDKS